MKTEILLCGVGGQGTVLASKLLAGAAMAKGMQVRSAETIGMAQKGGSVFSHLRIGEGTYAPMMSLASADILLAFEPAEAVRMLPYLKIGGTVIVNRDPVIPVNATLGENTYTGAEMIDYLKQNVQNLYVVDGKKACAALGSEKVLNMVLLGQTLRTGILPFTVEDMMEQLKKRLKPALLEMNEKALRYEE